MAIPGERHKSIGQNQKENGKNRFFHNSILSVSKIENPVKENIGYPPRFYFENQTSYCLLIDL